MTLAIIAAVAINGVIGRDGAIPWRLPHDTRRFRAMVEGHPLIMGRRTYESHHVKFPHSIVVSGTLPGDDSYIVVPTVAEAIRQADGDAFVLGGHGIFREALQHADRMYLTRVHAVVEGDTYFPATDSREWVEVDHRPYSADLVNEYAYTFVDLERIRHA